MSLPTAPGALAGFLPRGYAYWGDSRPVPLNAALDSLIALAYVTIPLTLAYIARQRKDLPFEWIFVCFGVFLLAGGAVHALEAWTFWHATYWLPGTMKAITAAASVASAILLVQLTPRLLAIPNPGPLRQANAALQQQQAELRVLFDLMPAMVIFKDTADRILRVNRRLATSVGKSVGEIEGRPAGEIFPETAAKRHADDLDVIRSAAPKLAIIESFRDTAGQAKWTQTDKIPYFDRDGKVVGIVVMAQDITARKQAEAALKESQLRYRQLFENMLEGYAYCRLLYEPDQVPDFIYLEVNSAFEPLTGLKDVIGKKASAVAPGIQEANPDFFESCHRVTLTGRPESHEFHVPSLGAWFSISVYSHEKDHFATVFDNITERKRADTVLRESNEKFQQLADNITDAFWIRSPDMREVHYLSPGFERIWGRSAASLYANPRQWSDFTLPEDRNRVQDAFAALMGDTPSLDIEYRITRPDGEIRWIRVRGFQVRNATGELIRLTGTATDITAWKEAGAVLKKTHHELVDASRRAGMAEVATGVLHNVGNVLNSVNVSATVITNQVRRTKAGNIAKLGALLREHEADLAGFLTRDARGRTIPQYLGTLAEMLAAEQQATLAELDHLRKNIEHIKEIVARQQGYARTAGVTETIPVPELIEEALRINAGTSDGHDAVIVRDYHARAAVSTDKHKVIQILVNLLRNARHACDESGRAGPQVIVRTTGHERAVRIAVIDNGVGIPAENLPQIFSHGFTTKKTGHGFGLHSAALAARELGGALTVASDGPGRGATFTLELPGQPGSPLS